MNNVVEFKPKGHEPNWKHVAYAMASLLDAAVRDPKVLSSERAFYLIVNFALAHEKKPLIRNNDKDVFEHMYPDTKAHADVIVRNINQMAEKYNDFEAPRIITE